jgi:hypothetical protein
MGFMLAYAVGYDLSPFGLAGLCPAFAGGTAFATKV